MTGTLWVTLQRTPPHPPYRATCVLLYLMSPLPACDSTADNPHLEKKKNMFSEMSTSNGESSRLELLSHSLAGTSASLPAFLPLHSMNIGYPHCEINNAFWYFFPSQDVGNSIASVKSASKSKLSKAKGYASFFFFFFFNEKWEAVRGINFDRDCFFTVGMCIIILEVLLEKVNHQSLSFPV